MRCPTCQQSESKVIDSRPANENRQVRRRRECLECHQRFTTYETLEASQLKVIKKDGRREDFQAEKVQRGLTRAIAKSPMPPGALQDIVDNLVQHMGQSMTREIASQVIGEWLLERLKTLDPIIYLRFASVYRGFRDPRDILLELEVLFESKERQLKSELEATGFSSKGLVSAEEPLSGEDLFSGEDSFSGEGTA